MILESIVFWVPVFIAIVAFLGIDLFFVGLFRAMRKGRFKVIRSSAKTFGVRTNFGLFTISEARRTLAITKGSSIKSVLLADIIRLKYSQHESWAGFAEFFFGFDLPDLFPAYQDRVNWHTIKLVMRNGEEIPVFIAGEYEPREFLFGWYLDLQASALRGMGFLKTDVTAHAHSAIDILLAELRRAGADVTFP